MKQLCVAFLLFSLLWSCKSEVNENVQLLSNMDMEMGATTPRVWEYKGNGTDAVFNWTTTYATSPSHSLEISATYPLNGNTYWVQSLTKNLPFGHSLTLTAKVKGVLINGTMSAISIACLNSTASDSLAVSSVQSNQVMHGTFEWNTFSVSLQKVPNDATEVRVYLMLLSGSTGQVYFDDVKVVAN